MKMLIRALPSGVVAPPLQATRALISAVASSPSIAGSGPTVASSTPSPTTTSMDRRRGAGERASPSSSAQQASLFKVDAALQRKEHDDLLGSCTLPRGCTFPHALPTGHQPTMSLLPLGAASSCVASSSSSVPGALPTDWQQRALSIPPASSSSAYSALPKRGHIGGQMGGHQILHPLSSPHRRCFFTLPVTAPPAKQYTQRRLLG